MSQADNTVREATMSLMRAAGFSPEAFQSGNDFLKSEGCGHTDCLIADVQMPGMSGLEMHGRIVQSGNDIPTVLITAYPDDKTRARAYAAIRRISWPGMQHRTDIAAAITMELP